MAFENIDFYAPAIANQAKQAQFLDMIGRGIQAYQSKQDRDLRERQYEQARADKLDQQAWQRQMAEGQGKGFDLERMAQMAALQQAQAGEVSPEGAAAIKAFQAFQRPTVNPMTGETYMPSNIMDVLGGNQQAQSAQPSKPTSVIQQAMNYMGEPTKADQAGERVTKTYKAPRELGMRGKLLEATTEADIAKNKALKKFEFEMRQGSEKKKKNSGRVEFERKLETVLNDLDALKGRGGAISQDQNPLERAGALAAEAPFVGQVAQSLFDPETQTLRDKIEGSRPALFNSIKKASGLTGGELNSQFEVENQLKQLGNPSMTYEARRALLSDLSNTFGTGDLASGKNNKKNTPTREQALEILRQRGVLK